MYSIYEYPGIKIGVTRRKLAQRDRENRRAYAKRGISLPEIILLETTTDLEYANRRERELQLERGYPTDDRNYKLALIGNKYSIKKEAKEKRKKSYKKGYLSSEKCKKDREKNKPLRRKLAIQMGKLNGKPVNQIDKNTLKVINTFSSTIEAGKYLKVVPEAIQQSINRGLNKNGTRRSSAGYYWEYSEK